MTVFEVCAVLTYIPVGWAFARTPFASFHPPQPKSRIVVDNAPPNDVTFCLLHCCDGDVHPIPTHRRRNGVVSISVADSPLALLVRELQDNADARHT